MSSLNSKPQLHEEQPMLTDLNLLIESMKTDWPASKVLVVGDLMLDEYLWGKTDRVSPEAPVLVVRADRVSQRPGGAANVAMNVAGLGASVDLIGFGGGDSEQRRLEELLRAGNVKTHFITLPGKRTTSKLRVISGNQQIVRVDREDTDEPDNIAYSDLLKLASDCLNSANAVILSDYSKGTLNRKVCAAIITEAEALGIPVLVDPKSPDFDRYSGATLISPNIKELTEALGGSAKPLDQLLEEGQALVTTLRLKHLVVTLSEKGIAVLGQYARFSAPAVAREVFDVSGAGDTVIATLALCITSGMPIETAASVANIAAGVAVGKLGTAPVFLAEVIRAMKLDLQPPLGKKLLEHTAVAALAAEWRARGRRVVFTNGCFDLLHPGHIDLIEKARREGDHLIVALNSDKSVRELKGKFRPVVNEEDRAIVIAALAAVDAVVIFDEATPIRLIERIRPDVLVKGGDYCEGTVVGSREVRSWGGTVKIIPTLPGYSSTQIIERASVGVDLRVQ